MSPSYTDLPTHLSCKLAGADGRNFALQASAHLFSLQLLSSSPPRTLAEPTWPALRIERDSTSSH